MEFVEGLPSRILVKWTKIIIAYRRHLDEGRMPSYLLCQRGRGTKELLGRVKAIAGGIKRAWEVAFEVCGIFIKSLATVPVPRLGGCQSQRCS